MSNVLELPQAESSRRLVFTDPSPTDREFATAWLHLMMQAFVFERAVPVGDAWR